MLFIVYIKTQKMPKIKNNHNTKIDIKSSISGDMKLMGTQIQNKKYCIYFLFDYRKIM